MTSLENDNKDNILRIERTGRYGKSVRDFKKAIRANIENFENDILQNPKLGELKSGDLFALRVYKLKFQSVKYRLAYIWYENLLYFIDIGARENFYRDIHEYIYSQTHLKKMMKAGK